ncbi:P-loop containing nucleoside triphosphate hydrolase protein [Cantharellus anzutake]|uniref:P-loop containing nucleoside triphosphate hydrolase protein n=1 Tax=Cantharellus anzutake TaxID=1750568 RepID=UPI0019061726|nr:P-loop containing nucleoside triphosphate hydrolase protein [Cantharellus anzutake]KAF8322910.1 P-loop containing nucleoside triphosphate hydrolase protein [Cantharellus anzutake]
MSQLKNGSRGRKSSNSGAIPGAAPVVIAAEHGNVEGLRAGQHPPCRQNASEAVPCPLPQEVDGSTLSMAYDSESTCMLRAVLKDPTATFRSPAQYHVYKEIVARKCHCLFVSACGSGKTLPFVLAAKTWALDGRQSVLVLPYQILHPDMHRRLGKANISHCKWTTENPYPKEQVVTIAIESFDNDLFMTWLTALANGGQLGCLMFDEAHGIMEDRRFRPAYEDAIHKLSRLQDAPIVFTSGTMSRDFMSEFWRALDIRYQPDEAAIVIHTSTQRPQIFYQFMVLDVGQEPQMADLPASKKEWNLNWHARTVEVICEAERGLKGDEQGLVFFVGKGECMEWAGHLNCSYITADVPSQQCEQHFENWREGKQRILCLNKAGYYGFDYHAVAFSIFVGQPFSVNDFYQSSGRVARGLSVGLSLVLLPAVPKRPSLAIKECFEGRLAMTRTAQQLDNCHWVFPSQHLDGVSRKCMELRKSERCMVLCAVCHKKEEGKLRDYNFNRRWGKPFAIPGLLDLPPLLDLPLLLGLPPPLDLPPLWDHPTWPSILRFSDPEPMAVVPYKIKCKPVSRSLRGNVYFVGCMGWQEHQLQRQDRSWKRNHFCAEVGEGGKKRDVQGYCWICLLDKSSTLAHRDSTLGGCMFRDMIPEMAWIILGSERLRKALADYAGDDKVVTISGYESWLLFRWEGSKKWRNFSTQLVLFFFHHARNHL